MTTRLVNLGFVVHRGKSTSFWVQELPWNAANNDARDGQGHGSDEEEDEDEGEEDEDELEDDDEREPDEDDCAPLVQSS